MMKTSKAVFFAAQSFRAAFSSPLRRRAPICASRRRRQMIPSPTRPAPGRSAGRGPAAAGPVRPAVARLGMRPTQSSARRPSPGRRRTAGSAGTTPAPGAGRANGAPAATAPAPAQSASARAGFVPAQANRTRRGRRRRPPEVGRRAARPTAPAARRPARPLQGADVTARAPASWRAGPARRRSGRPVAPPRSNQPACVKRPGTGQLRQGQPPDAQTCQPARRRPTGQPPAAQGQPATPAAAQDAGGSGCPRGAGSQPAQPAGAPGQRTAAHRTTGRACRSGTAIGARRAAASRPSRSARPTASDAAGRTGPGHPSQGPTRTGPATGRAAGPAARRQPPPAAGRASTSAAAGSATGPSPGQPRQAGPRPRRSRSPPASRRRRAELRAVSFAAWRTCAANGVRRPRGGRTFIREPDRVIIRENGRTIVRRDEAARFRYNARDVRQERRGDQNVTIVERANGTRVMTYTDNDGRMLRRSRMGPDGREVVIIENRYDNRSRSSATTRRCWCSAAPARSIPPTGAGSTGCIAPRPRADIVKNYVKWTEEPTTPQWHLDAIAKAHKVALTRAARAGLRHARLRHPGAEDRRAG